MRLTGTDAIEHAEKHGLPICKYTDPIEEAREDLTVDEATQVAKEDAELIYIDVECMSTQEKVAILAVITTRDEAGTHFTELYSRLDWLEAEGLLEIHRPVHEATGIEYSQEHWSVGVTEAGGLLVDASPEYWPEDEEEADETDIECPQYDSDEIMAALGRLVIDQYIGFINAGRGDELRDLPGAPGYIINSIRQHLEEGTEQA